MKNHITTGTASGNITDCMEKIKKDMGKSITDYTENGICSRCGACCSVFLPLSEREIQDIRSYLNRNHIEKPVNHKKPEDKGILIDMLCPFLKEEADEKAACTIYENRPEICRVFRCDKTGNDMLEHMDKTQHRTVVHTGETFFPSHYTKQQVQIAKHVHGLI